MSDREQAATAGKEFPDEPGVWWQHENCYAVYRPYDSDPSVLSGMKVDTTTGRFCMPLFPWSSPPRGNWLRATPPMTSDERAALTTQLADRNASIDALEQSRNALERRALAAEAALDEACGRIRELESHIVVPEGEHEND